MTSRDTHSGASAEPVAASRNATGPDGAPETEVESAPPAEAEQPQEEQQRDTPTGEEHEHEPERRVELDLEELEAKAEKADEYLELAQRTKADFENYKKRTAREAAVAEERGVVRLARELLPAIDNLERALAAADGEEEQSEGSLSSGIRLVQADLTAALARVGIEPFSPAGEKFDPQRHEAMAQLSVDGAESGTIVEVYQRGYTLGDAVLRPARVVVAG